MNKFDVNVKLEVRTRAARAWLLIVCQPVHALFGPRIARRAMAFGISRFVTFRFDGGPWQTMDHGTVKAMIENAFIAGASGRQ